MHRTRRRVSRLTPSLAAMLHAAIGATSFAADRPAYVPPPRVSLELPSSAVVTGPRLREALEEVVPGASWKDTTLRDALNPLAESHSIAVLRDRRIDPTRTIDLSVASVPLRDLLDRIASEAGAEVRLVGNCVCFCPQDAAAVVRTVVELRKEELTARSGQQRSRHQVALRRNQTVRWADLTEAREALRLVAARFDLSVENPELLPHDLWGGAVFAEMSSPEMLTLLLLQFDLMFAWGDDLRSIRLVPLPADRSLIVIKRTHRPRDSSQRTIASWRRQVGEIKATINGHEVEVAATVEQHEGIERLISGRPATNDGTGDPAEVIPLARRQFTLTASGVPAKAIMAQLESTGITFEFDAEALKVAEIDLETPVSVDVDQADAKAFFEALFGPLKLSASFSGTTVRLEPAERSR